MGWVGLGQRRCRLTQCVSTDDVYKLNISYQCIKKWHRHDLRWDPSRPICWEDREHWSGSMGFASRTFDRYVGHSSHWLDISALRTLYYWLNSNGTFIRTDSVFWFLPARRYASAGYRDRNVSVCPSRAGIVSKRRKLAARFLHHLIAPRL